MKISSKMRNCLLLGIVVIILIILLYLLLSKKLEVQAPQLNEQPIVEEFSTPTETPLAILETDKVASNNQVPLDDRARTEVQLEKEASAFVERWVSLSNQDNFSNLAILKNQMTDRMINWTNKYIQENMPSSSNNKLYMGVEGQAIVANGNLKSETATSLTVEVKIRGKETIASTVNQPKIFYQDYQVDMVKSGGVWLVDKLTWGERKYQE